MSTLASVICVLIVATASSAVDPVPAARKSFDAAYRSAIMTAEATHGNATTYVNAMYAQVGLEMPLLIDNLMPSAKCYEFLEKRIEKSRSLVVECSQDHLKLIMNRRQRMDAFFDHVLDRLREHNTWADLCISWYNEFPYEPSEAATCIKRVQQKMEEMIMKVDGMFMGMAMTAEKAAASWVSDAGRCVASKENPDHTFDWVKACKIKN